MEPVPPRKLVKKKRIVKAAPNISSIVGMWCAALIDQTWFNSGNTKFPLLNCCPFFTVIFKNDALHWCLWCFTLFTSLRTTHFKGKNPQSKLPHRISPVIVQFLFSTGQLYLFQYQGIKWRAWYVTAFIFSLFIILEKKVSDHNLMQAWFNIWVQSLKKKLEPERSAEDDERRIMKNMEISTGKHWHFTCVFKPQLHSLAGY